MHIVINKRRVRFPILPAVALLLLVILSVMSVRVGRIQANEIGVFVNDLSGEISVDTAPGAKVYNGWLTDFYVVDNVEQSFTMGGEGGTSDAVNIKTRDGADVSLDVTINYRLTADVEIVRTRVIPECGLGMAETTVRTAQGRSVDATLDAYKVKWIRDYSRSVIRYQFGELIPKEFYDASLRNAKAAEAKDELNQLINSHGIIVTQVVPGQYRFYPEYETIINDTKAAEQEQRTEESKAEAALEAQQREETKATATSTVAITGIEGDLKKAILQEEAEMERAIKAADAYAYSTKTAADAEFYKAQNEAKSILATAEAEAEGMRKLAESLGGEGGENLVKLRYAEALKSARITGVPYAIDPRIQKVDVSSKDADVGKSIGAATVPAGANKGDKR